MRRPPLELLLAAASLGALLVSIPSSAQKDQKFAPVPPEAEYFRRKELMAKGLMPNYKALWTAFQSRDAKALRTAAAHIDRLAKMTESFPPPTEKGNAAEYRKHLLELQQKAGALVGAAGERFDKSAVHGKILELYAACQGCHDDFAPEEGKERRKYSPPA